jgi:hypothetical protein
MIPGSANPLLLATAAAGGYTISRSLRFNSADSAYLSRTPASAGNRKTWTWAGWVKKCGTKEHQLFTCVAAQTDTQAFIIELASDDTLRLVGWNTTWLRTTQVFRDFSAWLHIVVAIDSTNATANNRARVYVNGAEVTQFSVRNNLALNTDYGINQASTHEIGRYTASGVGYSYLNGYLADIHFIDGQALDPTSFGEFSATTGVWMPKAYTGSYGTNGFKLDFADNSAATAAALGKDTSGNGNNWTPTNLSVTAGAGNDSLVDVPTNGSEVDTGAGGQVRGNYATINPLTTGSLVTLSNGNLQTVGNNSDNNGNYRSTFALTTGKWYVEVTCDALGTATNNPRYGLILSQNAQFPTNGTGSSVGIDSDSVAYQRSGAIISGGSVVYTVSSYGIGDVIGIAIDADNGAVYFSKNGTWQNSGVPTSGGSKTGAVKTWTGGTKEYLIAGSDYDGSQSSWNFGQRPFAYTAPSGFKALCTANLPAPTIVKPSTVMDVVTYTGTGSTLTPTSSLGFSPDLIWIKSRSAATDNTLYDIVRGAQARLESNNTDAEVTSDNGLTAFNSAGFTLGTLAQVNTNAATYAAWTWDGGSSTVTNTAGTITSSVRANASAGFSVVTYTGTGAGATVGHGLGVGPELIIVKRRNGATDWATYHKPLGATKQMFLNLTLASTTTNAWNSTSPTSTVFSLGNQAESNSNGNTFVAYCFAPVAGYSAFGSYTGNGSTDGPFVYTGMRPRYLLIKSSTFAGSWAIFDSARSTFNFSTQNLAANSANAEVNVGSYGVDILSNGFKVRTTDATLNGSANTYLYAAFSEAAFQYSRAR